MFGWSETLAAIAPTSPAGAAPDRSRRRGAGGGGVLGRAVAAACAVVVVGVVCSTVGAELSDAGGLVGGAGFGSLTCCCCCCLGRGLGRAPSAFPNLELSRALISVSVSIGATTVAAAGSIRLGTRIVAIIGGPIVAVTGGPSAASGVGLGSPLSVQYAPNIAFRVARSFSIHAGCVMW